MANRLDVFCGNSTSPLTRTPTGTIAQHRKRVYYRYDADDGNQMFDLVDASATTVQVRGGMWVRRRPSGTYYPTLTVDDGFSGDPEDVKTLSGFAASKTYDIYVELNGRSPTALIAFYAESPVFCPPTRRMVLGQVVTDADANITSVTQWRPGGLIQDYLAADAPWLYDPLSVTGGEVVPGIVYIGGAERTVTDFPGDHLLAGIAATTKYWVKIDFLNATATWESGAALPANTATLEHWHVLTLTVSASKITGVDQPWNADIRAMLNP